MDAALTHVGNTDSVSSMTPVYLIVFLLEYPKYPNILRRYLCFAACIHRQGISHCLCQGPLHILVVVCSSALVLYHVNQTK